MKKNSISESEKFHKSRTAFLILDDSIRYLRNSSLSHEEWCENLNIDDETFNSIVRGYILNNNMFYYMGDFECNDTVIKVANETHEQIAIENKLKRYRVFCGVKKGKIGEIWKPFLQIKKINLIPIENDTLDEINDNIKSHLSEIKDILIDMFTIAFKIKISNIEYEKKNIIYKYFIDTCIVYYNSIINEIKLLYFLKKNYIYYENIEGVLENLDKIMDKRYRDCERFLSKYEYLIEYSNFNNYEYSPNTEYLMTEDKIKNYKIRK